MRGSLSIDMRSKLSSKWNMEVRKILLELIRESMTGEERRDRWDDLPERSDAYFDAIFSEQLQRAKGVWKEAQPKCKEDGDMEATCEVEARMVNARDEREKIARSRERRRSVSFENSRKEQY